MRPRSILLIGLSLLPAFLTLPPAIANQTTGASAGGDFFVIGLDQVPQALGPGDTFLGAAVERVDRKLDFIRVSADDLAGLMDAAQRHDRVQYVEPDPYLQLIDFTPDDPSFSQQYGPQHVRAPEVWDSTLGDLDARVCVVDTGVRYTHEDLSGARWLGGTDFINGDGDPMDDNGHGTHVAGIAAGTVNNATGISGLANVGVYGVKVLSSTGSGPWSAVASGIRWCADNGGARVVISMSLSGASGTMVIEDAVKYAQSKGALLVAAAGNNGPCSNCVGYPAKYPEVVAVTCTTSTKAQCAFSSDGPESELAAPGASILSTWHTADNTYNTISGTSMSTPHVTGVAALVWSEFTGLTNDELRQFLAASAQDLGVAGRDELFGHGLVDAKATFDAARGPLPPPPPPPAPETRLTFETFDDGVANGWTRTGLWHVSSACSTAPSAPKYLGYNEDSDCQYSTGARTTGSAILSADLTVANEATLGFAHRFEKEYYLSGAYDVARVQVSTNGGSTWSTLKQWDSRNTSQSNWATQALDLDPYVGGVIKLRFYFDSVDNTSNNYLGWLLDDVEVTATYPSTNQPPVSDAGFDQTVADDDDSGAETVALDATESSDSDGTIESYEWREGNNVIATGATPAISLGVGTHSLTLTVADDDNATASDDVVVTVAPNQAPVANFSVTSSGLSVQVDGSSSSDSDGTITSYSWNWGDGSPNDSGIFASHTYQTDGSYTITLTVTDNGGAIASATHSVDLGSPRIFFEDFDDGVANGWALSGLWHVSSVCSIPPSAPNYLGYNQDSDCEYSTGSATRGNADVTIDITGYSSATLSFMHRFEKELFTGLALRDVMKVMISTDGGASWVTPLQWDSGDPDQLAWTQHSISLNRYAGSGIKLRFGFDSRNHQNNNFEGWFLDDVEVTAQP